MKKYILTLFALIFAFSAANAQEFTISGTVTDTEDEPLAGVAVIIQETKEGTMTDGKGRYTIEAEEGQTLEFSFIGMVTQNVTVGKRSVIDIQMTESAIFLDEAVAIGYGVAKKSDLTGAVASVKAEDLQNAKIGTVTSALQGLATGVQVTTGSTKPGGDASVIIAPGRIFVRKGRFIDAVGEIGYNRIPHLLLGGSRTVGVTRIVQIFKIQRHSPPQYVKDHIGITPKEFGLCLQSGFLLGIHVRNLIDM